MRQLKPCGTRAAYDRGCRCTPCRDAFLSYHRAYQAAFTPEQKERRNTYNKTYRAAHRGASNAADVVRRRDRLLSHRLVDSYGITLETFREVVAAQGGTCCRCRVDIPPGRYALNDDAGPWLAYCSLACRDA